jgi:hypothetical protein
VAFTADEIAYLQTRLGSAVNEDTNPTLIDDLETRYARLGTAPLVAVEVLRIRLANIADPFGSPLQYAISGEYSQDGSNNVAFLKDMLRRAEEDAGLPDSSGGVLTSVPPADDRWRPGCGYDTAREHAYQGHWYR